MTDQNRSSSASKGSKDERGKNELSAIAIVDEVLHHTDSNDDRLTLLLLLRQQIEIDQQQYAESQELIEKYDEAYNKLTQPANRIAVVLAKGDDGTALIAMGDSEFYTNIDPSIDGASLDAGTRVRVNDAYAVVGALAPSPTGHVVKVVEALEDGRLRVGGDAQGAGGRIILRGAAIASDELKEGQEIRVEPNFRVALESFAGKENKDFFLENIPPIEWTQIGGQDEAIGVIRDAIELPLLYP